MKTSEIVLLVGGLLLAAGLVLLFVLLARPPAHYPDRPPTPSLLDSAYP